MDPIVVITGGSRGIGAATARLAAARGYAIAVNYLNAREEAEALVREIVEGGGRAVAIKADMAIEADIIGLFATVDRELGPITALVNNAGITGLGSRVEAMDATRLCRILAINVTGCFIAAREAVKRMSRRHGGKGGAIVNVSSAASRLGSPGEFVDYAASKGAIDTFTIGLAKEVAAEGIRVNAVRPGLIETGIHAAAGDPGRVARIGPTVPMQRSGSAEEVAAAILWLLSEEASYTTGGFVEVSGGR